MYTAQSRPFDRPHPYLVYQPAFAFDPANAWLPRLGIPRNPPGHEPTAQWHYGQPEQRRSAYRDRESDPPPRLPIEQESGPKAAEVLFHGYKDALRA
jgi:hypothetical protein